MHIKKYLLLSLVIPIISLNTFALGSQDESIEVNSTSSSNQIQINKLILKNKDIDNELIENNIWIKIYSDYHTYQVLEKEEVKLRKTIEYLEKNTHLNQNEKESLEKNKDEMITIKGKLQLLKEYKKDPFKKFLTPPEIEDIPKVENPFAIIGALSFREKLYSDKEEYSRRYNSLQYIIKRFKEKEKILKKIISLNPTNSKYTDILNNTHEQIRTFLPIVDIFKTTKNIFIKKVDEINRNLKNDIKKEIERTVTILFIIFLFILLLFIIKYLVKRYMSDNDRFYTINKALNITFISISLFTLLFAYIENVSYMVTILGFASAGIAIAMKDWFMSLMGWFTIVLGGAIHVGDRVKFVKDGVEYVGDIVDISMLRMTMHEDITLTTVMTNRRAGRIIFIPNNFIFTDMIANYAHAGLKTVWDGIDFMITFDSDIHKASSIAKEVTKKYSKGYTDITRKQLNKLRSQYSMKNTNVEPRTFTFIEPYGVKISAWYLTNAYATLTLRSTISAEIISRIQEEDNIHIAFPTQSIYMDKNINKPNILEELEPTSKDVN